MATHKVSSVTIDEYQIPKGSKQIATLICGALMAVSTSRTYIEPRSFLHDKVLVRGGAKAIQYSKPVQDFLFYFLFGTHSLETVYFALTKLRQHNVKVLSTVWLKWVVTVFVGGAFARKHFDEVVEAKEIKTVKQI